MARARGCVRPRRGRDGSVSGGSGIHPEMALLVEGKKAMNAAVTPEETARAFARYAEMTQRPHPPDMQVEDRFFPGPEGGRIPVRHYRPRHSASPAPCILYFHGGGFVLGDLDSSDTVAWGVAESVGVHLISVDYRLAPRHPFPAAPRRRLRGAPPRRRQCRGARHRRGADRHLGRQRRRQPRHRHLPDEPRPEAARRCAPRCWWPPP